MWCDCWDLMLTYHSATSTLRMGWVVELIAQIIEDGDDSDLTHAYISSEAIYDVLTTQLLASGQALIY